VPAAEAEIARARLLELESAGFEEKEDGDGEVELAAYVGAEGEERIRAVFGAVSSLPVEDGWQDRWRAFHRPVRAGGLWIGPPWEAPPPGELAVTVDPGRAFGTGAHPTTRACIELLARQVRGSLLDAGCGSGVIAVAAARLGFTPVSAVDVDPVAVDVALETARRNGVEITASVSDALSASIPVADLVVANIELPVVERLLARRPAGTAITSGYFAHETPSAPGWEHLDRIELDGWAADVLRAGS
jgi:ribosomal protein L11 methyltransferase